MASTILTPAENRFLQLTYPALADTTLTRLMPQLREHPTVKTTSPWLSQHSKQVVTASRIDWLVQGSLAWKLLARLPYAINPSEQRSQWHHCALCHLPVRYEYHVVLRSTGAEIVVGSECVKKFMSDETQYLMTITTEDNFHAVAQYDRLTAVYPQVPEILWEPGALPELPANQHAQHRWVRRGTKATVTGYLKHRTQTLPERQLTPYLQGYTDLQAKNQAAVDAEQQQRQARAAAAEVAEQRAQQAAWRAVETAQTTAEQRLRSSPDYQNWLTAVAELMVTRPSLATFKQQLTAITAPTAVTKLINAYQLGVLATEFGQRGQITGQRVQIVPQYLIADLDQRSQALAAQRLRDWYDDLFNAAFGLELTADQRQTQLTHLRQSWEGQRVPAAVYAELQTIKATWQPDATIPATWPVALQRAFTQRLAVQPSTGWVPARKNHVTTAQLRGLLTKASTFTGVAQQFERLYALPLAERQVTLSALEQAYLQLQDRQAQRQQATQTLVQRLLTEN